jgi:hypothetical protein
MPPGHDRNVIYTYRYLRIGMIALLLMLIFSVGYQAWSTTGGRCWLGSISAYYFTPARTVFVGSLCALGACLIAYKGHTPEEDVLLDFSGLLAFVVAMVPTTPDSLCGPNAYSQTLPEIGAAVSNNIWSLIAATAVGLVLRRLLRPREAAPDLPSKRGLLFGVISLVCIAVLALELAFFLVTRGRFIEISHYAAAVTMVIGVIGVMVLSALREEVERSPLVQKGEASASYVQSPATKFKKAYLVIAGLLVAALGVAVLVAVLTNFDHLTLWIELAVIALFGVYWAVQTRELWNLTESTTIASIAGQPRPAEPAGEPSEAEGQGSEEKPSVRAEEVPAAPTAAAVEGRGADIVAQ